MNPRFKDEYHARIRWVDAVGPRPLWSVLIPTYNCADYLEEALSSVLKQAPGPEQMEIIVIDDHSTKDDPRRVVDACGAGRVRFIRQRKNVGKVRNYETGLHESKGHLIHQLHGDDRVRSGFYTAMGKLMRDNPAAGAGFCRSIYIDKNGKWDRLTGAEQYEDGMVSEFLKQIAVQQRIQSPSMVVRRGVYEELGGFDRRLNCMEDWEMWIRIANAYPVAFCNQVLAEYRVHNANATHATFADSTVFNTQKTLLEIVDNYLDPDVLKLVRRKRALKQAEFLLHTAAASKQRDGGWTPPVRSAVWRALKYSRHPRVLLHGARLFI